MKQLCGGIIAGLSLLTLNAATARELTANERGDIIAAVDSNAQEMITTAKQIWEWAEVGFRETQSSQALQQQLQRAQFTIRTGVADMPTAFVASFRHADGNKPGPVIGILAEFDALPGQSQAVSAVRAPFVGQTAGHACGHNLLGAGAVGAALALKQWMLHENINGEIRVYGAPAEEGGSGKVYMVRAGLFNDVDVVLHWHPNDANSASQSRTLANMSGKFRFHGIAAHAARAPEKGRSVLEAVEALDFMVNAMRQHIPQDARIHYIITNGGASPNVVPDFAEVYYYVRHVDPRVVRDIMERVQLAAKGAALGTGTTVDFELTGAVYSLLPNNTLGKLVDKELHNAPGIVLDDSAKRLAVQLLSSLSPNDKNTSVEKDLAAVQTIEPYAFDSLDYVSTDVGDVSWVVPTAGIRTATWVHGTPAHSWQATAASGAALGFQGMLMAAKALALSGAALFRNPQLIQKARDEFSARRGDKFNYEALLGDRPPALDYRTR